MEELESEDGHDGQDHPARNLSANVTRTPTRNSTKSLGSSSIVANSQEYSAATWPGIAAPADVGNGASEHITELQTDDQYKASSCNLNFDTPSPVRFMGASSAQLVAQFQPRTPSSLRHGIIALDLGLGLDLNSPQRALTIDPNLLDLKSPAPVGKSHASVRPRTEEVDESSPPPPTKQLRLQPPPVKPAERLDAGIKTRATWGGPTCAAEAIEGHNAAKAVGATSRELAGQCQSK